MDEKTKAAFKNMLKTLEKIQVAINNGDLIGNPEILKEHDAMARFVSILNALTIAIQNGRGSYDKVLY